MTKEKVEALAKDLYIKDEIRILLKGYDLGYNEAINKLSQYIEQQKY